MRTQRRDLGKPTPRCKSSPLHRLRRSSQADHRRIGDSWPRGVIPVHSLCWQPSHDRHDVQRCEEPPILGSGTLGIDASRYVMRPSGRAQPKDPLLRATQILAAFSRALGGGALPHIQARKRRASSTNGRHNTPGQVHEIEGERRPTLLPSLPDRKS